MQTFFGTILTSALVLATGSSDLGQTRVAAVIDGDTIRIERNGALIKVRLADIDSPEISQSFGRDSKAYLRRVCLHKRVKIVTVGKDKYGRELSYVYLPSGKCINNSLLQKGFAWVYPKSRKHADLVELERCAQLRAVGLWKDNLSMPPWQFRKEQKNHNSTCGLLL